MVGIFLKTVPFFAIIGLGYLAGRTRFFTEEGTAWLTRFVFYFALSAMLFRFSASLRLEEVLDWSVVAAYLGGTAAVYILVTLVAAWRRVGIEEAAIEAQAGVVGNVGFLGVPMLPLLLGREAIGPVMLVLSTDLVVFGSLVVILISAGRGRLDGSAFGRILGGLVRNPMIVSIALGLGWSTLRLPLPAVLADFLTVLGGAATPGALFAIGASLACRRLDRPGVALWLSGTKLVLHPLAVAIAAFFVFDLSPGAAAAIVAAAALPTAGNVYMLAQHYRVAPLRASATILFSTAACLGTLPVVLALVGRG
ncbi:MAG: AEC family transporter [Alphaproteobacteria bacterium]|nr:MAG: AEC family transporter [Alphaproteobacteria bacterium]